MKIAIFDVDGTLYNQKKLRLSIGIRLGIYYLLKPYKSKELIGIYKFRKLRESDIYKSYSIDELIDVVSKSLSISNEQLEEAISYWMFTNPLDLINKYKYDSVIKFIQRCINEGYKIVFYSDYPTEEKLKVLGLESEYNYYPSADTFSDLKPSIKAMEYIINSCGYSEEDEILFVGDRPEKDGESAKLVGAKFINVIDLLRNKNDL